jgi:glycosyltransferase involved in cell wall biosynthesis
MNKPSFSCVIPVKGERPFFGEAIDSLKAQGMGEELEIIVQDGGVGSGGVEELGVEELHTVKWFRESDAGQSDALNKGFAKAKGEWLFWLNADDVLLPGALKKVLDRIDTTDRIDWIAGDTVYLDEKGVVKDVRTDAKWRCWFGKKLSVWTGGPSAFFRRELWERHGGFDTNLKYVMDIDLWTRWAQAGIRFENIGSYVWGFRMHDGSKTMSGRNKVDHRTEREAVLLRHNIASEKFWRNISRVASVMDGSWFKRVYDAHRFNGMSWKELVV